MTNSIQRLAGIGFALFLGTARLVIAADTLTWRADQNRVDADIRTWELPTLLKRIAATTGWKVYVDPGATHTASAKFQSLPVSDALRRLLGDLNFALVPQNNSNPHLLVFRTSLQEATQLVQAGPTDTAGSSVKRIPNELIVTLKPGAKIDELARALGAKVIGRLDRLNAYRLQFDDEASADAARAQLSANSDVTSVESNYYVDRPAPGLPVLASSVPPLQLKLNAPGNTGRIIVGLIDTPFQSLGTDLDKFIQPSIAVVGDAQPDPNRPTHSTSMAETILTGLQSSTGGSTSVQILPVDVYGNNPNTTTFEVALGIYKAVNAGANPINLSLGSYANSDFLHNVIQQAHQQGILFFAAPGNTPVTTPMYPAAYPEVLAVTASDPSGKIAPYASRWPGVSFMASGTSIIYYNDKTYYVEGTSVSTAIATGTAAGLADSKGKSFADVLAAMRAMYGAKATTSP